MRNEMVEAVVCWLETKVYQAIGAVTQQPRRNVYNEKLLRIRICCAEFVRFFANPIGWGMPPETRAHLFTSEHIARSFEVGVDEFNDATERVNADGYFGILKL